MISREKAERLVHERINGPDPYWPDRPEMIVVRMQEHPLGWLAFWDSRPHHETGEFRHTILGNAPLLVSYEDGTMFFTATGPLFEKGVHKAEHQLRTYLQTRTAATFHPDT